MVGSGGTTVHCSPGGARLRTKHLMPHTKRSMPFRLDFEAESAKGGLKHSVHHSIPPHEDGNHPVFLVRPAQRNGKKYTEHQYTALYRNEIAIGLTML